MSRLIEQRATQCPICQGEPHDPAELCAKLTRARKALATIGRIKIADLKTYTESVLKEIE